MNNKLKIIIGGFALLAFIGAGCASSGPQAEIKNPQIGDDNAPVTIVEYFDYQCPACKAAESAVVPFILEDYVKTGKAKITFWNMAFIGEESITASVASLCAAEKGKFLEYHTELYKEQGAENSGVFTNEKMKNIAVAVGLDVVDFDKCLHDRRYEAQIKRQTNEAFASGVQGTPTFIINGQTVQSGSYLSVKRVIDNKLNMK